MRPRDFILSLLTLCCFAILVKLGFWQLDRLAWKQVLIATIEARRSQPAQSLSTIEKIRASGEQIEFLPVSLSGVFDHQNERYFLATEKGQNGWHVYTPLLLDDGRAIFVNRGFVPDELKTPETRLKGQIEGGVKFTGLVRLSLDQKPGAFVPDNVPEQKLFYWKNLAEMRLGLDASAQQNLIPLFVDAANDDTIKWPKGGITRIELPNNHLGYAITWFGLALALFGIAAYFIYSTMIKRAALGKTIQDE